MALLNISCPGCRVVLKSPTGFSIGQSLCCPKCEVYFAVEESGTRGVLHAPAGSGSPLFSTISGHEAILSNPHSPLPFRFGMLGGAFLVATVLVFVFFDKIQDKGTSLLADTKKETLVAPIPISPILEATIVNTPVEEAPAHAGIGAVAEQIGDSLPISPEERAARIEHFRSELLGSWKAEFNNASQELVYTPRGSFTIRFSGPMSEISTGSFRVKALSGTDGMRIQWKNGEKIRVMSVILEGDELRHPSQHGEIGNFRRR